MKTKEYKTGNFDHLGRGEYYERVHDMSARCKPHSCFEFEGRFFAGDITNTIKQYLQENPSKSLYLWLIDNGLELTQQTQ